MKNILRNFNDVIQKLMYILNAEQKKLGIGIFMAGAVGSMLETIGVSAMLPLISVLMTPEKLMNNAIIKKAVAIFHIQGINGIIVIVIFFVIMVYVIKNFYFIFLLWLREKYAGKVKRELSIRAMDTYMSKGYCFFLTQNTSTLMRGVFADAHAVYSVLSELFKLISDCLTVGLICLYMLLTDWIMAVAMMGLSCVCVIILFIFFKGKMQQLGLKSREYGMIVNQNALQVFHGIKEVIVMHKQKYFVDKVEDALIKQNQLNVKQAVGAGCPAYIIELICVTGLLVVVGIRIFIGGGNAGEMIPTLSAFAVGAFRILPSLGRISGGINAILFQLPSLDKMYIRLKETEREDDTLANIYMLQETQCENNQELKLKKDLQVKGVYWSYGADTNYVLKGVDLTINKGESIALIGQSGAGKTTLADIMLGLLKPHKGQVTLDGRDIFTIGEQWRNIMGYVPQSVYLADDTIRNNIAFGVQETDIDDDRIWKVLGQAQLKEFVERLDQKLDTRIGERGVRFSGGQRQRVAIARALYENPDILILDEATAALDNETEDAVMESIEALQGMVTLIIIAHRLTTIKKCNKVYEVKDGMILERNKKEVLEMSFQK